MGWETHLTAGGFFGAFFGHSVDPDFGDGFFPSENSQLSFGDGFPAVVDDLELLLGAFSQLSTGGIQCSGFLGSYFCRRF